MNTWDFSLGIVIFTACFLLTVLGVGLLLPTLRRLKVGQHILEIGPSWHSAKAGTPTMGGLGFILSVLLSMAGVWIYAILWGKEAPPKGALLVVLYALCCGATGFFDDWCKVKRKENQGLSAPQKYFLLLLFSALFLLAARAYLGVETAVAFPFWGTLELGFFYYPLALLFLTGMVNALNLTDGVDGLLGSTGAVMGAYFLLFGVAGKNGTYWLCGLFLLGACLGFLLFNAHPAKIFMGDTGSLFLGGLVAGAGLVGGRAPEVLVAGGVFVLEAASVALQVVYFKCTHGKRLFKMAPLHHHFEKSGMGENAVVALFSLLGVCFAALALWGGVR